MTLHKIYTKIRGRIRRILSCILARFPRLVEAVKKQGNFYADIYLADLLQKHEGRLTGFIYIILANIIDIEAFRRGDDSFASTRYQQQLWGKKRFTDSDIENHRQAWNNHMLSFDREGYNPNISRIDVGADCGYFLLRGGSHRTAWLYCKGIRFLPIRVLKQMPTWAYLYDGKRQLMVLGADNSTIKLWDDKYTQIMSELRRYHICIIHRDIYANTEFKKNLSHIGKVCRSGGGAMCIFT